MSREALTRTQRNVRRRHVGEITRQLGEHITGEAATGAMKLRGDRLKAMFGDFGIKTDSPPLSLLDASFVAHVEPERLVDISKGIAIARRRLEQLAQGIQSGKVRLYAELGESYE